MSKFLKLKSKFGGRVLIAVDQIATVNELDKNIEGSRITLVGIGEEVSVKESYQTIVNRLTKGDEPAGE